MTHAFPPGCERQPKWLRQKAMVMTYARCSYLPTDIFSSILARFPQSGYERMRPQSQFVFSAGCSNNPADAELTCTGDLFLGSATIVGILLVVISFFKCWIWNSISRSRACCTNIHVEISMQLRPTCASTTIWILISGCRGYVFQFLALSPSVYGGSHSA